jgi:hypothetical protein
MENGYSGGIDVNQVMARYGAYSDVFQTFIQANSQVILYVDEHGPAGSLASVAGLVRADCQQYGAGTGS